MLGLLRLKLFLGQANANPNAIGLLIWRAAVVSLAHMHAPKHGKEGSRHLQALGIEGDMTVSLFMAKDLASNLP